MKILCCEDNCVFVFQQLLSLQEKLTSKEAELEQAREEHRYLEGEVLLLRDKVCVPSAGHHTEHGLQPGPGWSFLRCRMSQFLCRSCLFSVRAGACQECDLTSCCIIVRPHTFTQSHHHMFLTFILRLMMTFSTISVVTEQSCGGAGGSQWGAT